MVTGLREKFGTCARRLMAVYLTDSDNGRIIRIER
jgi:hypothetical protein